MRFIVYPIFLIHSAIHLWTPKIFIYLDPISPCQVFCMVSSQHQEWLSLSLAICSAWVWWSVSSCRSCSFRISQHLEWVMHKPTGTGCSVFLLRSLVFPAERDGSLARTGIESITLHTPFRVISGKMCLWILRMVVDTGYITLCHYICVCLKSRHSFQKALSPDITPKLAMAIFPF